MSLIDQYVFEVGENLPEKQRVDLEKEIRSLIEDTLEERSSTEGRPVDEEMLVKVLKEFGPPAKMAASYQPARYLIGPRLYPTFILVLKIVGSVICVLALIGLGVDGFRRTKEYSSIFDLILESAGQLFQSLLAALGNVVFVFAIMERFIPQGVEKEKDWDPRSMKPISRPEKVSRFEQAWIVFWSTVAILLFNFYPELLKIWFLQNGQWFGVTFLSDNFFKLVPALTAFWVLEIILSSLLFADGKWQPGTRWFKVAIKAFSIALLSVIIAGPPILKLVIDNVAALPEELSALTSTYPVAYTGFRVLLSLVLVLEVIEFGKACYCAVTGKQFRLIKHA